MSDQMKLEVFDLDAVTLPRSGNDPDQAKAARTPNGRSYLPALSNCAYRQ